MLAAMNVSAQWQQCDGIYGGTVNSIASSEPTVFATTNKGIYISNNNGVNWSLNSFGGEQFAALAINGNYMYASPYWEIPLPGIYFSTNNGANWALTSITDQHFYSIATNGNIVYMGTSGKTSDMTIRVYIFLQIMELHLQRQILVINMMSFHFS